MPNYDAITTAIKEERKKAPYDGMPEKKTSESVERVLHQSDFPTKVVKQKAIDGFILQKGLAANRPDGSSDVGFYFATDTFALSVWTGSAWKSVALS